MKKVQKKQRVDWHEESRYTNQIMGGVLIIAGLIFGMCQFVPFHGETLTTIEWALQQPYWFVQVLVGCTIGGVLGYMISDTMISPSIRNLTTKRLIEIFVIVLVNTVVMNATRVNIRATSMLLGITTLPLKIAWVATFLFVSGALVIWKTKRVQSNVKQQ